MLMSVTAGVSVGPTVHVCAHVCVFAKFITEMLIEFSTMSMWVGLMNHISGVCVCVLNRTAKMAEGPDPGQTSAKCEFIISSTFEYQ